MLLSLLHDTWYTFVYSLLPHIAPPPPPPAVIIRAFKLPDARCGELRDGAWKRRARTGPTSAGAGAGTKSEIKYIERNERGRVNKKLDRSWEEGKLVERLGWDLDRTVNKATPTSVTSVSGGRTCLYCRITSRGYHKA
jgi:hypothetical protein